jgi:hypothetical protein
MPLHRLLAGLGVAALLATTAFPSGRELNGWPVRVAQTDDAGTVTSWQGAGPLLFSRPLDGGRSARGFRPFYLEKHASDGRTTEVDVLYPFFIYQNDGDYSRWSIFDLINRTIYRNSVSNASAQSPDAPRGFDVWPFYFSRQTGSPEDSYRALFPIAGTVKNRFSNERATWALFPLYLRTENHGAVATSIVWPFVRTLSGAGNSGFALWPLYGQRSKPGVYHNQYALWPLLYRNVSRLDEGTPKESIAFLPFYARDRDGSSVSETYLWPFFGYTDRTAPYRYHETHYLWPLFVQGRGDDRYRSRWAPFYTHSLIKGTDKQWWMWPLLRRENWTDDGLVQTKTQFCYFLYWSLRQQSARNPQLASAHKTHVWPLYSGWNNGAGQRQWQVLSPVDVFLPRNENTRLLWSPLFAIYRFDQRSPGVTRHSVLFDLITWRREPERREFHLGPLFSKETTPDTQRIGVLGGLLGVRRTSAHPGWRPFWFDFSSKSD